jgi:hypothetical protein
VVEDPQVALLNARWAAVLEREASVTARERDVHAQQHRLGHRERNLDWREVRLVDCEIVVLAALSAHAQPDDATQTAAAQATYAEHVEAAQAEPEREADWGGLRYQEYLDYLQQREEDVILAFTTTPARDAPDDVISIGYRCQQQQVHVYSQRPLFALVVMKQQKM